MLSLRLEDALKERAHWSWVVHVLVFKIQMDIGMTAEVKQVWGC